MLISTWTQRLDAEDFRWESGVPVYVVYLFMWQFRLHDFMGERAWGGIDVGMEKKHSVINNQKRI